MNEKNYWDGVPYAIQDEESISPTPSKNGIWQTIFGKIPDILHGAADLTDSIKGNPNYYVVDGGNRQDRSGTYLAVGGVVLVIIVILVFALRK